MARLTRISASSQFAAVAWLRLRLFVNGFRRKGGKAEIFGRILLYPIAFALLVLPVLGAGFGSFYATKEHPGALPIVFWAIFALQLVVSLNISPPGLAFDPASLLRFPLSFSRYLAIRLALGLFSASAIAGTLCLLSAALGISLARPSLALAAFAASILLAVSNILLIRTVFAWVDRWLSTRRAREAMTGLIIAASVGFQYLNMTYNTGRRGVDPSAKLRSFQHAYGYGEPVLSWLPPGLAARSIRAAAHGRIALALAELAGIILFAAASLAVFSWRMGREYRGENLSESGNSPAPAKPSADRIARLQEPSPSFGLPPAVAACIAKELLYIRRNVTQFYALLVPLAMVFIVSSRFGALARSGLVLPCAVAYSFLSIAALSYNVFGLDATGVQTYLLAPVPLRTVVLSKNLIAFSIAGTQFLLLYLIIAFEYGVPPAALALSTLCWLLCAAFLNTAVGNIRSVTAPKKMDPGKLSRRQASQLSAFLALGLVAAMIALGFGLFVLARFLHLPWLPVPLLASCAVGGYALYATGLNRIDLLALKHRESLLEELCKAS